MSSDSRQVLSFRIGEEDYAIDILRVREIRAFERPTRIVGAPDFVRGVVNLRGSIVPIVDLRLRFGFRNAECGPGTVTIILRIGARDLGVVVDGVSDVLTLGDHEVKPPPDFEGRLGARFIKGIVATGERMLLLLEVMEIAQPGDVIAADLPAAA